MSQVDDRFDGLLMNIAQQRQGIEPLLDTVFAFLRRKTDFFAGATPEMIEGTVLKSVRKQQALADRDALDRKERQEQQEKEKAKVQKTKAKTPAPPPAPAASESSSRFEEITDEQAEAIEQGKEKKAKKEEGDEEEEEDDGPKLEGNGGTTDKYFWTQTLQEVQVNISIPEGTKAKQIDCVIKRNKLHAGLKGQEKLVDGELFNTVKVEDSFWTIEDSNRICVYLQKDNQMEWWKCVIKGDAEIDTKKVVPENSRLEDLDADTRQTVEKMMFDQRQKQMGLPTSEEQKKQEMLQKFMKSHPEMDFSKAKIN